MLNDYWCPPPPPTSQSYLFYILPLVQKFKALPVALAPPSFPTTILQNKVGWERATGPISARGLPGVKLGSLWVLEKRNT